MVRVPVARILVIDDDPEVVDILVTHLCEEGYGVSGALTSDEGLKLVILSRPDLVLLDVLLPGGMNGIEVLKRIRSINPTAKVIMVTGEYGPPARARGARTRRTRLCRQTVRFRLSQARSIRGAPAGDHATRRSPKNLIETVIW